MSITVLTRASSGSTRNSGTYGDLTTLLDWALVGREGWTLAHTATNERIYQSTSGFLLYVNHASAVSGNAGLAVIRGCESATAVGSRTDDFPLAAQVANGSANWLISSAASTADRPFYIKLTPDSVEYWSQFDGTYWECGFFGQPGMSDSADNAYDCVCMVRESTSVSTVTLATQIVPSAASSFAGARTYWMRDQSGTIKSSRGSLGCTAANLGGNSGQPVARGGLSNLIRRQKIALNDGASQSTTAGALQLPFRGWWPRMWHPLHSGIGAIADGTTFGDTPYHASASFRAMLLNGSSHFLISEETDTWNVPSG